MVWSLAIGALLLGVAVAFLMKVGRKRRNAGVMQSPATRSSRSPASSARVSSKETDPVTASPVHTETEIIEIEPSIPAGPTSEDFSADGFGAEDYIDAEEGSTGDTVVHNGVSFTFDPTGAYIHTNRRLFKRYRGRHIDWPLYLDWCRGVREGRYDEIERRGDGVLYAIPHDDVIVFVVYCDDVIVTALEPEKPYRMERYLAIQGEKDRKRREWEAEENARRRDDELARYREEQFQRSLKKGKTRASRAGRILDNQPARSAEASKATAKPAPSSAPADPGIPTRTRGRGKAKNVGVNLDHLGKHR